MDIWNLHIYHTIKLQMDYGFNMVIMFREGTSKCIDGVLQTYEAQVVLMTENGGVTIEEFDILHILMLQWYPENRIHIKLHTTCPNTYK